MIWPYGMIIIWYDDNMAIEIVDLPIKHGDVPSFCVCLPEGNHY